MNPWTLAYLAGHRDMNITKRYVHARTDSSRRDGSGASGKAWHTSGHTAFLRVRGSDLPPLMAVEPVVDSVVRPERFELPTFWFVGMQPGPILLTFLPTMTAFEANAWRTKAAVDERLMKGRLTRSSKKLSSTASSHFGCHSCEELIPSAARHSGRLGLRAIGKFCRETSTSRRTPVQEGNILGVSWGRSLAYGR